MVGNNRLSNSVSISFIFTHLENALFAIGGNSGTCSLDTCEKYDPILDKWSPISPMKNRRHFQLTNFSRLFNFRAGAGVAVIGPYIYVIGGFDDDSPLSSNH